MTHDTWSSIVFSQLEKAGKWMFEHILLPSALTALKDPQSSNWCYGWVVCCSGRLSDRSRDRKWRHSRHKPTNPYLHSFLQQWRVAFALTLSLTSIWLKRTSQNVLRGPVTYVSLTWGLKPSVHVSLSCSCVDSQENRSETLNFRLEGHGLRWALIMWQAVH